MGNKICHLETKKYFKFGKTYYFFCGITFLRRFETTILLGANMYLAEQWHCVLRFPENADVVHNMKWNEHLSKQSICISIEIERIDSGDKTWLTKKEGQNLHWFLFSENWSWYLLQPLNPLKVQSWSILLRQIKSL